jgi:ClpP class serine protease
VHRLKREGVIFNTVTAGKFKRTLTPFKETNELDLAKTKEDIAQVPLEPRKALRIYPKR